VLSAVDKETLKQCLQSPDVLLLENEHISDIINETDELVILRAKEQDDDGKDDDSTLAYCRSKVITLHRCFYSQEHIGCMDSATITLGHNIVNELITSRLAVLLHEFLHLRTVANLEDMPITRDEYDAATTFWLHYNAPQAEKDFAPTPNGYESEPAYGIDNSTALKIQGHHARH